MIAGPTAACVVRLCDWLSDVLSWIIWSDFQTDVPRFVILTSSSTHTNATLSKVCLRVKIEIHIAVSFVFFPFLFFLATLGQKVEYLKCSGKVCPHSLCAGVEARYKQPSVVRDKPQLNALITPSCCFQPWKFTYSSFKDGYPSAPQGLLLSVMARSSRKDNKEGKSCANKCGLIFLYCRKSCWVYPLFSFPVWFRHSGTLFTGSFAVLYDCAVYFNAVF